MISKTIRRCVYGIFVLSLTFFTLRAQQVSKRPNILFIFTDDHGVQAISSYGSNRNSTPNLDRISNEGVRFDNCFCGNSICAPSRATILTGKHTHITGHTTNEKIFDNRQRQFPQMLQEAGYETALIGKWHLNVEPKGFDYWDIVINQGVYYNPPMISNGQYIKRTGYTTDVIADLTIEWLEQEWDTTKPFLLMSQHKAPHRPWDPPLRYLTQYDESDLPEPPTLFDDWSNRSSAWSHAEMSIENHLTPVDLHLRTPVWQLNEEQRQVWDSIYGPKNEAFRAAKLAGIPLTKWKYQRYVKDYLRSVQAVDDGVGKLLDYLDRTGLSENTIVIYSSDQGWYLGEHGMFDKRWMYEESFRMPLMARWPGVIKAGSVNTDFVQNIDFAPTMLELAGIAIPPDMQGRSIVPLLRGTKPKDWRTSLYYQFYEDEGPHKVPRHYGVRTDRYKLIHYYTLDEWELFDLKEDPNELVSLYGKPGYEQITENLEAELQKLRKEFNVTEYADRDADAHQASLKKRRAFMSLLGALPSRWNVNVDTLAMETFEDYSRYHISYAIGKQRVEAYVLVPKKKEELLPGVVAVHPGPEVGSYAHGKSLTAGITGEMWYHYGLDLCRRGYVVMCPDRVGFESRQLSASREENELGLAALADTFLVNRSTLLAQEIMELWFAEDYLSTRPGVHFNRVGFVGYGEGGLLATIIGSVNEEIWTVVSMNGIESLQQKGLQERDHFLVPGLAPWGDTDETIALMYPRPYAELTSMNREELMSRARERYKDYSFSQRLQLRSFSPSHHAPTQDMKASAYDWLDRWLK